jgi:hypothetical protein
MATGYGRRHIQALNNYTFGKSPDGTPAGVIYVALFEGDPGDDGQSGVEANGTGYARVLTAATDWNVATLATPSETDNANAVAFAAAGGDWNAGADMTHFALFSTLAGTTEADYVGRGLLTTPQPVLNGQIPNFPAGALRMTGTQTA